MKVNGKSLRSIEESENGDSVIIIDQTQLPHRLETIRLQTIDEVVLAIVNMQVRGAPLIGVTAAYGMYFASMKSTSNSHLREAHDLLLKTRPTAVNLRYAVTRMINIVNDHVPDQLRELLRQEAKAILELEISNAYNIGLNALGLIQEIFYKKKGQRVNVLTHCNAGWLATVDWGTALSPVYQAYESGIDIHVWVDETRPRNQGASLTAWELLGHGIPHTVISDNMGGHLMQMGEVDLVITGADRITKNGDVCNKIGTYLKALAANDNHIPFIVAAPLSTIDWDISDGISEIEIEKRDPAEVTHIEGLLQDGTVQKIKLTPEGSVASNYAFDVTPNRLVDYIVTEKGVFSANEQSLQKMVD